MEDLDALTAVIRALTPAQRDAIVGKFTGINPHYTGAEAADILDVLESSDANLDQTEPFFEQHTDLAVPGAYVAALALIWSGTLTRDGLETLLHNAGLVT